MTTDELKTAARRRLPVTCHGRRYDRISAVRWYLDRYGGERLQAELMCARDSGGLSDVIELADPKDVEVADNA